LRRWQPRETNLQRALLAAEGGPVPAGPFLALQPGILTEQQALAQAIANSLRQQEDGPPPAPYDTFDGAVDVYASFEAQSKLVCQELLDQRIIQNDDVEAQMPDVLEKLTSLVVLRTLQNSVNTGGIQLSNGRVVKDAVMASDNMIEQIRKVFEDFVVARTKLESLRPSEEDKAWMERRVLFRGDVEVKNPQLANVCVEVLQIASEVQRLQALKKRANRLYQGLANLVPRIARALSGSSGVSK